MACAVKLVLNTAILNARIGIEGCEVSERDDIVKRGSNARAMGLTESDCPFYAADQCPAATGETIEQWSAKVDAWKLGWRIEDAIRDGGVR